ncbi:hypothetical protein [Tritonibacter horizontis]|uniref:Uncharacterized protein n=1 Tax=Tritonibacter horizontis TaxID=1768241 RepID=A0A132BT45_9RHOB|nr:hypothetical protein [Tritonibacter horizontis]KUP91585.1 hypothetical protein TRIHO_35420 [Tritonibacter horizontis]
MNILEQLAKEDPQKLKELSAFHWFTKAAGIAYENLQMSESPDFLAQIDGRRVGIEITEAHRQIRESEFPMAQMENAHRKFAEALLAAVDPALPIDIGLIFNDGVPAKKDMLDSIEPIAALIREVSVTMQPHSVKLLVRNQNDLERSNHEKHICTEIPDFLQHVQLLNDGHEFSVISGAAGCSPEPLSKDELDAVLAKKHKALMNYNLCEEYWLVIVTRDVPNILSTEERPRILLPSNATSFWGISFDTPINSQFDRVYLFESPTNATLLTE